MYRKQRSDIYDRNWAEKIRIITNTSGPINRHIIKGRKDCDMRMFPLRSGLEEKKGTGTRKKEEREGRGAGVGGGGEGDGRGVAGERGKGGPRAPSGSPPLPQNRPPSPFPQHQRSALNPRTSSSRVPLLISNLETLGSTLN